MVFILEQVRDVNLDVSIIVVVDIFVDRIVIAIVGPIKLKQHYIVVDIDFKVIVQGIDL